VLAEHDDPRPRVDVPDADAPWLLVMAVLDEVISTSSDRNSSTMPATVFTNTPLPLPPVP
jgi:hypothetical protein